MIPVQLIARSIEDLKAALRTELEVYDASLCPVASTSAEPLADEATLAGFLRSPADSQSIGQTVLIKASEEDEPAYIVAASGMADAAFTAARIAAAQLGILGAACRESTSRSSFFQALLLGNLLPVDVHNQSRRLHISYEGRRGVIVFACDRTQPGDETARRLLQEMFREQNGDYLTELDEKRVILIRHLEDGEDGESLRETALMAVDLLETEALTGARAAAGSIADDLGGLSAAYKEAMLALECSRIFMAGERVADYARLGAGRLIYQLPPSLCETYLREIFGDRDPEELDGELRATAEAFYDNDLNISETARRLFIHRNTLVYRIERIEKISGLDIRRFRDAAALHIALMVLTYMKYREQRNM